MRQRWTLALLPCEAAHLVGRSKSTRRQQLE